MKNSPEKDKGCLLVIGEWQVAKKACMDAAKRFLEKEPKDQVTVARGDEYSQGQVLELLKTKGLFSPKRVVIYQDPDFLGNKNETSLAKQIDQALKKGKKLRAARLLGRFLASKKVEPSVLKKSSLDQVLAKADDPDLDRENLLPILEEYQDEVIKAMSQETGPGDTILSWINAKKKAGSTLLIIHLTDIPKGSSQAIDTLKKNCKVIDLRISQGQGHKGQGELNSPRSYVIEHLSRHGKEMGSAAIQEFLSLVGTKSVSALRNELDKLIALCADQKRISLSHVTELVSRHKEEELYKLADTLRKKDLTGSLVMLELILQQNVHPLAVLSLIRSTLVRILALKGLSVTLSLSNPGRVSFNEFKARIWPDMKQELSARELKTISRLHPYSAFLHLQSPYTLKEIASMLEALADLDLELKGSKVEPRLVLERFFFRHLK